MNKPEIVKLLEKDKQLFLQCVAAQVSGIEPYKYIEPMEIMAYIAASLRSESDTLVSRDSEGVLTIKSKGCVIAGTPEVLEDAYIRLNKPTYADIPVSTIYLYRLYGYWFAYNTELIAVFKKNELINN